MNAKAPVLEPLINFDKHGDYRTDNRGLPWHVRKERFAEMFRQGFDPDELTSERIPDRDGLERLFREVMADPPGGGVAPGWWPRADSFKIRLHPHLKRITLFRLQPARNSREEDHPRWFPVSIFQTMPAHQNHVPADLDFATFKHLRGTLGEFRIPTRRDFELIREAFITDGLAGDAEEAKRKAANEDRNRQIARDILDYTARQEIDFANQRAGSGEWMSSAHCMAVEDTETFLFWPRGAFRERVKVGSERWKTIVDHEGWALFERLDGTQPRTIDEEALHRELSRVFRERLTPQQLALVAHLGVGEAALAKDLERLGLKPAAEVEAQPLPPESPNETEVRTPLFEKVA